MVLKEAMVEALGEEEVVVLVDMVGVGAGDNQPVTLL